MRIKCAPTSATSRTSVFENMWFRAKSTSARRYEFASERDVCGGQKITDRLLLSAERMIPKKLFCLLCTTVSAHRKHAYKCMFDYPRVQLADNIVFAELIARKLDTVTKQNISDIIALYC